MNARIVVFAKPPVPGAVKTRLAEPARAAALARAFLVDTCDLVRSLPWARGVISATAPIAPDLGARLALPVWPQGDGDLGARIERMLQRALAEAPSAFAIGADTPGLPPPLLEAARAALADHDAVLGPTDDGGFYLLGVRGACPDGLLAELPWSSDGTFAATHARLVSRGLAVATLAPWFDVDRPADLARLRALLDRGEVVAPATAEALAS